MTRTNWTRAEIADLSILPELVSGRGTTRRVVEGQAIARFGKNPAQDGIGILKDIDRPNPERVNARRLHPCVASRISLGPISHGMRFAVDFDRQPRIAAKEVEDVGTGRVLAPEFQSNWAGAKRLPDDHFRQCHLAAQATRIRRCSLARFRRDIFQHRAGPSTVLRTVPLPETSSGRI